MGLVGPNGAGKTTIITLVMNLVRREAGEIRVFGAAHAVGEDHLRGLVRAAARLMVQALARLLRVW